MEDIVALRAYVKQQIDKADEKTLRMMQAMLDVAEGDWWEHISEAEKASIERGLQQAANGQTISHEEAMKKLDKWFTK